MNILHINTNSSGGAANACIRIHIAHLKAGFNSHLLVLDDLPVGVPNAYSFKDFEVKRIGKLGFLIKKYLNKIINKLPFIFKPKAFFNKPTSLYDISKHPCFIEADIIHFHWVVKFIDYTKVFKDKNKKIVWTMHDMAPFSGGYHYLLDFPLSSYETYIKRYEKLKKKSLQGSYISVIGLSRWLIDISLESEIFGNFTHYHIPNCIDVESFSPNQKEYVRQAFALTSDNKKTVLFVAENVEDRRKGFIYLKEALSFLPTNILLLVMGKSVDLDNNLKTHNIGFVSDTNEIIKAYVSADVFVIPSVEDNLPNTVMEALSCGTPVVGFNIGGIPDMIDHKHNGYLASSISAEALAEGINYVLENPDNVDFAANARAKAVREYSESIIAEKTIGLYKSILNQEI